MLKHVGAVHRFELEIEEERLKQLVAASKETGVPQPIVDFFSDFRAIVEPQQSVGKPECFQVPGEFDPTSLPCQQCFSGQAEIASECASAAGAVEQPASAG